MMVSDFWEAMNPKDALILWIEQPLNGFGMKQKGLRSKHAFGPKYNF